MMHRREAIKNIGLTLGFVVATPTIMSLLNSCTQEPEWMPSSFTKGEGELFAKTLEIILPKTDTPGARELNLPQFIDKFINEVMPVEQVDLYKKGFDVFKSKVLAVAALEEEKLYKAKEEDIEPIIASTLKKTKEEEIDLFKVISSYQGAIMNEEPAMLDDEPALFAFMNDTRSLAIWAFKTNEYIGEEVMAYISIPGKQQGCVDLEATTGGKAWSL